MSYVRLRVVSGQKGQLVGTIIPRKGMQTKVGVVSRVTQETVYFTDGSYRRNTKGVTVTVSEAKKWGYPHAIGCTELVRVDARIRSYIGN